MCDFFRKGTKKMNLLLVILQKKSSVSLKGGSELNGLLLDYKEIVLYIIGAAFLIAGLAVVKKLAQGEDDAAKAVVRYIVALAVFLGIWALI